MKNSNWLLQLRSNNMVVLAAGLVLLLTGVFSIMILNTSNWWSVSLIVLGILILGLFLFTNLTEIKEVGKKRTTITRANLFLIAIAMLGIVGALNYIVSRHPYQWDLTSNKFYTLSPQTLEVLKNLKTDVNVTMFISSTHEGQIGAQIARAEALLQEYQTRSDKFHFKIVDTDRNPAEAREYGIHEYNTVVFESGDNRKDVLQRDYISYSFMGQRPMAQFQGESAFTSALLAMSDTTHLVFYFTQGHGEKPLTNPEPNGYTTFQDMLEKENYDVKTINLLEETKVPSDAAGIIAVGPLSAFEPYEAKLLEAYAKSGGKIMLFLDLMNPISHQIIRNTGLNGLLKDFGIKVDDDLAIDNTSYLPPNPSAILPVYGDQEIVQELSDNHLPCLMVFNREIEPVKPAWSGATPTILMQTTPKGWGVYNLKEKIVYHPGVDVKGPIPIAVASEWDLPGGSKQNARMVVYGNSNFFSNQFASTLGNMDLALNSFAWLGEQQNKITIHPKEQENRYVNISNVSNMLIIVVTIILIPLGTLVAGFIFWFRRRSI